MVVLLRIKEDNKLAQKSTYTPDSAKDNMVEHDGSSSKSNSKEKEKAKRRMTRRAKGRLNHRAANCKMPKRVNPRQANMVNDNMDMIAMVSDIIAMISEVNPVCSNNSGWWVDTKATRHVCADKSMFYSFRAIDNGEKLYIGNCVTADIKGEGDNLLSGWLLNRFGFRLVFESDKFVLSKNKMYVGRYGYCKNLKKTVKAGQTRTRERIKCTRAGDLIARRVKMSTLGQQVNSGQTYKDKIPK
ncbi:hypothetical protein Tco_1572981 [Tanacetum coccineum]